MSTLPPSIENLVQEYNDEKVYRENLNNTNQLLRKQILKEELKNISVNETVNFKLSRQLAINFIEKFSNNDINVDLSCLTGIFLSLLGIFTYEQLLYPADQTIPFYDEYNNDLYDYIFSQIRYIEKIVQSSLTKLNILPMLNPELQNVIKELGFYVTNDLLKEAYAMMLKNEPDVYSNLPWENYINKLEKYVKIRIFAEKDL